MSWDALDWLRRFRAASARKAGLRPLRAQGFEGTVAAVRAGRYTAAAGEVLLASPDALEAMRARTVLYRQTDALVVPEGRRRRFVTGASVLEADCLEVAHTLKACGLDPVVLNMADRRTPGGEVIGGAGAQEENLCRRTNLYYSLFQFASFGADYGVPGAEGPRYPIPEPSGAVYSPGVEVLRSSERTGYTLLEAPYTVSVVSVPALPRPATVERDGSLWLRGADAAATRVRIRAILRVAAHHGHDSAVLSALGCGAFRNPPHHMAALFSEVFAEPEFQGSFKALVFAIIDDHNAWRPHNPEGNLRPFQRVFDRRARPAARA